MTAIDTMEALMKEVTPALPWDENTKVTSEGLRLALAAAGALPDLLEIPRAVAICVRSRASSTARSARA